MQSPYMASTISPNRRVLGNKSTNASVHKRDRNETTKTKVDTSALRSSMSESVVAAQACPRTGLKRRFQEVDGDEIRGRSLQRNPRLLASDTQTSDNDVEAEETENSDGEDLHISHSSVRDSGSYTDFSENTKLSARTVLTSFHASQEPPLVIEEQFEILQEEVSQKTLDKIHATPISHQSSQLLSLIERPALVTETSQDSLRMSSFIDYDEVEDTEKEKEREDEDVKMISSPSNRLQNPEEVRRELLDDKAETLRTRLQLAMHKIQTNQTARPFSRLDRPRAPSPELKLPPMRLSSSTMYSSDHAIRNSPESQIALRRARAFNGAYQTQPAHQLDTLPVPRIAPTAYSTRYVAMPELAERDMDEVAEIPSSPPTSNGSGAERMEISGGKGTPSPRIGMKRRTLMPKTPKQQLSSPPGSEDDDVDARGKPRRRDLAGMSGNALTSSVVKGEAANGLLELMRAASGGLGRMV